MNKASKHPLSQAIPVLKQCKALKEMTKDNQNLRFILDEKVRRYVQQKKQYPFSLNIFWQWCDFPDKRTALQILKKRLIPGIDFRKQEDSDKYSLSIEGGKLLAQLAHTEQGKIVKTSLQELEKEEILELNKMNRRLLKLEQQMTDLKKEKNKYDSPIGDLRNEISHQGQRITTFFGSLNNR